MNAMELKREMELEILREKARAIEKQAELLQKHEALLSMRQRCLDSLFVFAQCAMGFDDLYEPLHGWLADKVADKEIDRLLVLIPRGHFKTTIISICYPVWLLCRNPNERIILASALGDKAEENLAEIIHRVDRPKFQALFGGVIGSSSTWPIRRADQVSIQRTDGSTSGSSIRCLGVDSAEVGRHCSVMIIDDMVGKEQINTAAQREKAWRWFGRQLSVMDPNSRLVVVGTRWHEDDPYQNISKLPGWQTAIRKVKEPWPDGEFIFPTRFNERVLAELMEVQDEYTFSCFYLNDPVPDSMTPFNPKLFRWLDYPSDEVTSVPWTHILVDPAVTMEEYSCYTGIVIGDAVMIGNLPAFIIREAFQERMFPDKVVETIFSLVARHRPHAVVIEAEAQQKTFHAWIKQEMLRRKVYFQLREVKGPRNVRKEAKLLGLQPFIHNGSFRFMNGMPGGEELVNQLAKFPKGKHDDLVMALSFATLAVDYPPQTTEVRRNEAPPIRSRLLMEMCERGTRGSRMGSLDRIQVKGAKAWSRFQRRNGGRLGALRR